MIDALSSPGALLQQSYRVIDTARNWANSINTTSLLRFLPVVSLGTASLGQVGQDAFESQCESFADRIDLDNVTVDFVHYVAAGTKMSLRDIPAACGAPYQVAAADMCRVNMMVTTSNSSEIMLEAWFPRNYKGRFLSTGNGGLAGCIQYLDLAYAAWMGFATVGANNGHYGDSGKPFYHHPQVLEDFAYRSLHTGVVVGKELTNLFYDEGFNKSYYFGCSTGGRQGFKAVQEFPHDFDGVVAGAPAFNFVNLMSWIVNFYQITGPPTAETFLPPSLWRIVNEEILRQCDELDGAKDGIIEDPDLCHPTFETLICHPGSQAKNCLTGTQAKTVRKVLSPLYGVNGTMIYPRMQPGSELAAAYVLYNGIPSRYSEDWFRYVVYSDPTWDGRTFTIDDTAAALEQNPYNIQTWDSDLSAFRDAGGKVLTYHGLQDGLISSDNSKLYYSLVSETMNLPPDELDDFYRFFPISGMGHCSSGDGASAIGSGYFAYAGSDPEDNVIMAVVRWVEEGIPPDIIRGTKYVDGIWSPVEYRRRHCRYPRRNVYKGPGKYTDENAWECI